MFWPPEGLSQTANDDLYALGLTARAALTGESPADLKLTTVVPRRTALTPASRRAKTLDRFLTSTCAVEPKVRVSDETALRKLVAKRTLNQSRLLAMLGLFAMLAAVWIGVDRRRGVPMDEMPNRRNDVRVQDQRDSPDEGGEADIPAPRDYHRDYETYKHYASNLYDALDKGWVSVKTEARNQLAESAVNRFDLPEHQLHAEELERLAERIAEDGAEETRQVLQIDNATRENTAIEAVRPGDIDPDWVEIETLCGATRKFWGTNRKVVVAMKDLEVLQRSGPDLSWIIATFRLKVALSEYKRAFQLRDSRILIKDELLGDAELPGKLASAEEMFRRGFRDAEQKAHEAELALRNFYRSKEADDERWKEPLEWSPLLRRLVAIRLSSRMWLGIMDSADLEESNQICEILRRQCFALNHSQQGQPSPLDRELCASLLRHSRFCRYLERIVDNQPNADKWRTQADTAFEEANKIKSEPIDSTARKWGTDVSDEKIERDKHESEKVP